MSWRKDKRSSTERGYGTEWRKLRLVHLAKQPLCVYCQKQGKVVQANVVDHIKPHRGVESLQYDPDNLQSLCKPCHDRHKQREENSGKKFVPIGLDGYPIE
jgi:5-methylcytosine-specific restriction endonuclease McrA